MAWLNEPDETVVEFIPISFAQPTHPQHCPLCARATEIARAYPKERS